MKNFYLVPVTSRLITINKKPLFDMLEDVYSELHYRELRRIEITYEEKKDEESIKEYNRLTSVLYDYHNVPEKLIVRKVNGKYIEVFSGVRLDCENESYINVFKVQSGELKELIDRDPLYNEKVLSFIEKGKKRRFSFFKHK